jgi:hypothetical protein
MLLPNRVAQGVRDGALTLAFRRWEQPRVKVGGTQLTSAGIVRFDAIEEVFGPSELTAEDATAAGFPDVAALRRQLYPAALRDAAGSFLAASSSGTDHGAVPEQRSGEPRAEGSLAVPEERSGELANPNASRRAAPQRQGPRASKGGDHVYRVHLSWVEEDPRLALRDAIPDTDDLATLAAAVAKLDASKRTGPWTRRILDWIRENPGVISTELAALLGREVAPMKADIRRLKALGLTESLRVGYRLSARGVAYLESLG